MRQYPRTFEMPKTDKIKIKEDPKEHLRHFKYACYQIANGDALLLRTFSMTLRGQEMNQYNSLPQYSLFTFNTLANLFIE